MMLDVSPEVPANAVRRVEPLSAGHGWARGEGRAVVVSMGDGHDATTGPECGPRVLWGIVPAL